MNSESLQCGDSQGKPSYSLVLSIVSTLEILGEILKFPVPIPIKSESLSRKLRRWDCQSFLGDSMCRVTALTSHMLVGLPDPKAGQLGDKLSGWE